MDRTTSAEGELAAPAISSANTLADDLHNAVLNATAITPINALTSLTHSPLSDSEVSSLTLLDVDDVMSLYGVNNSTDELLMGVTTL